MSSAMHEELELLHKEFISMGNMVFDNLRIATTSVINKNADHVTDVFSKDKIIDGRENTIDVHSLKLWATQAPVADDLRRIFCIVRSTNELERLGDHCKSISAHLRMALDHGELHLIDQIVMACREQLDLLDQALQAYQKRDSNLARSARDVTKAGERAFATIYDDITALIDEGKHSSAMLIHILAIGHHFKRVYAVIGNICKHTVYFIDAEVIRHKGRQHPLTEH